MAVDRSFPLIPAEWVERVLRAVDPAIPVAAMLHISLSEARKLVAGWRWPECPRKDES